MLNQSIARTVIAALLILAGMTLGCHDTLVGPDGIGTSEVGVPLAVTSLSPNSGSLGGTTNVTIAGSGFRSGATVAFDGTKAAAQVNSGRIIFVRPPPHAAGPVDVVVTNENGEPLVLPGAYTYAAVPPPTITAVSPNSGPTSGGGDLIITGNFFKGTGPLGGQPGVIVEIGGTAATVFSVSSASIRAQTPAHLAGQVDVVVTNADGQVGRLAGGYTYIPVESLDFSGDWQGYYQDGDTDVPVRFTIRNNALTRISCGSSPILTLSPAAPVINGGFSFSGDDGVAVSGRFVSPSAASGTINLNPCTTGSWFAQRR